jgi:hypothetical protein
MKLKAKPEVEEKESKSKKKIKKRASSQEDNNVRPHDLEIIHPTSQPKPKSTLKLFLLSV